MASDRSSSSPPLTTRRFGLVANDPDEADALFNAMTPPMDTTGINQVRVSYWLDATLCKVKTAVQFSNDGVNWPDAAIAIGGSFSNTTGWTHPSAWQAIFDLTGTKRLWCRFGLLAITNSGSDTASGVAALSLDLRRVAHRTVTIPPFRVQTDGSTTTQLFNPATGPMGVEQFKEFRATLELACNTGTIEVQPGYQVTDNPEDWGSWGTATAFGTAVSSESIDFGTTFTGVTFAGSFVRFGFMVKNTSGSTHELARANLRVDLRTCPS